jgi:hypothetical protein
MFLREQYYTVAQAHCCGVAMTARSLRPLDTFLAVVYPHFILQNGAVPACLLSVHCRRVYVFLLIYYGGNYEKGCCLVDRRGVRGGGFDGV